jgi:hypothetical protein
MEKEKVMRARTPQVKEKETRAPKVKEKGQRARTPKVKVTRRWTTACRNHATCVNIPIY